MAYVYKDLPCWRYFRDGTSYICHTREEKDAAEARGGADSPSFVWMQDGPDSIPDVHNMSKRELEAWTLKNFDVDLDLRKTKPALIKEIMVMLESGPQPEPESLDEPEVEGETDPEDGTEEIAELETVSGDDSEGDPDNGDGS